MMWNPRGIAVQCFEESLGSDNFGKSWSSASCNNNLLPCSTIAEGHGDSPGCMRNPRKEAQTSKLVMNSWIESLKSSKFDEKNQRTLPRQAQVPEVSVPAEERPWKAQIGYWGSGRAKFAAIVLWKADLRGFLSWDFSVLLMCVYFTKYMTDVSFSKELAVWLKCLTTGMIPDLP